MRRIRVFFVVVSMLLLLALPASAQDYPKVEFFGGISYANLDDTIDKEREHFFGFQTSFAGNLNESFGIVGEFGIQTGIFVGETYEFMAGPRFASRGDRPPDSSTPCLAVLPSAALNSPIPVLRRAFGGGLDVNVGKGFAIRAIQFDYVPTRRCLTLGSTTSGSGSGLSSSLAVANWPI